MQVGNSSNNYVQTQKKTPVRWLTLASGLVSLWLAAWQAAVWRDAHSYLPHVLVGAQEALDVTEHLGNRHFSQTVEAALRRWWNEMCYILKQHGVSEGEEKVISAPPV